MSFNKLPSNSKKLLDDILQTDNPAEMLSKRFEGLSHKEDEDLRSLIRELRENGYISVSWADNKPYRVVVNNSARTYNEQLKEHEANKHPINNTYITDNSIKIGDNNKIANSTIAGKIEKPAYNNEDKKSFAERHPVLLSLLISLLAGFILLFSFWKHIIDWIEGLF